MTLKYVYIDGVSKELIVTDFFEKEDNTVKILNSMGIGTVLVKYSSLTQLSTLFYKFQNSNPTGDLKDNWHRISRGVDYYLTAEMKAMLLLLQLPIPTDKKK